MKPTDIWTNHPNPRFKPMCKNGDPCHASAPRGSRTGVQGVKAQGMYSSAIVKGIMPDEFIEHIIDICEERHG